VSLVGASALLGRLGSAEDLLANTLPPGALSVYNTHTRERLEVTYRDASGHYDPAALEAIDHVLRCHYTGEVAHIDRQVIEIVNLVDKALGGDHEIDIISGFRSPAYNDWLIQHGHGVAKHSLHLVGKAIDLRIRGVDLDVVRRTALRLELGGVGYYPRSDFVHVDSGRVRTW
jgi:uncharacterized protein YcbK (DUF882 family)